MLKLSAPESVTENKREKQPGQINLPEKKSCRGYCPRGQHKIGVSARFVTDFGRKRAASAVRPSSDETSRECSASRERAASAVRAENEPRITGSGGFETAEKQLQT